MKTSFEYMSIEDGMKKMRHLEKKMKKGKNIKVIICTIDFDNDTEMRKTATPDEGCVLIKKSKTLIYNPDKIFPHIESYSIMQDINHIKTEGIMYDIIWCGG